MLPVFLRPGAWLDAVRALLSPPAAPAPVEGIDVSGHQQPVDWARVKAAGVSFAYVKATEGVGWRDKAAQGHASGALAAGLDVGAYHYLRVRHGAQDAAEQAFQFLRVHRELGCTLVPALDVETQGNEGRTFAEYLAAIRAFVSVVEAELGRPPILYTYPGFWAGSHALMAADDLARCPLWLASYNRRQPAPPDPWTTLTMWQYAAGAGVIGRVDGVKGDVDRNRLFVPLDKIRL